MGEQHTFDLERVHVHPTGDDEVVAAAVEEQVAVGVDATEVADGERVAVPGGRGLDRIAPVLEPGVARDRAPDDPVGRAPERASGSGAADGAGSGGRLVG